MILCFEFGWWIMMYDNFMTYQECIVKFLSKFNDYVNIQSMY